MRKHRTDPHANQVCDSKPIRPRSILPRRIDVADGYAFIDAKKIGAQ